MREAFQVKVEQPSKTQRPVWEVLDTADSGEARGGRDRHVTAHCVDAGHSPVSVS